MKVMKNNFAGPTIMKDEVRAAVENMKGGKATGPDNNCNRTNRSSRIIWYLKNKNTP